MPPDRRRVPELMDNPALAASPHRAALRGLSRLNALAATDAAIWDRIAPIARRSPHPLRFLDIAAGSGDLLIRLARRASAENLTITFTAADISALALECASLAAEQAGVPLQTLHLDALSMPVPQRFDVAHCGLFLHHLDPPQVESILRKMSFAAPVIIVQDLRRSYLGLSLAATIPRIVTRSPIVHTDAILSVRAAYTIEELRDIADRAGLADATISRLWPQRMLLYWERKA